MNKKDVDSQWMCSAIEAAAKARGHTSPNPMVGAVVVRNGKALATGFHRRAGLPHAEIEALRRVKDPRGATLYVTLEPCCHEGKRTPPCTDALLRAGLKKIVIGALDPNPQVSGRGVKILRHAGLEVKTGVFRKECETLNIFYNHWMRTGKPWVILKAAASLDGRVALKNGQSRWITGPQARQRVHRRRGEVDGILVGVGTVLADDPQLTARHSKTARQPVRIVLDPNFRLPMSAKILNSTRESPCWVVVAPGRISAAKRKRLESLGGQILVCPLGKNGSFHLSRLLTILGKKNILSLLVEGGSEVWTEFYRQKCAQELLLFLAPKILGGDAKPLFGALSLRDMSRVSEFSMQSVEFVGRDCLVSMRFEN
ncbi:MAG TPA: bifunctional diaminohydroxyphosphoribosylaminopyrimidine deaminase/5-amino-6-(5-phosphoribosylamino)uracil reductase RibD [Deltaproteobacteria bacterium]|nr:bifunctional diaminohydroxyphosphoribosylaminopyrimidine deaminase/5-amino-6-(5-phosphoribosylamino)uracil reductase RibD [Deltaproteobacteria bacterium]